MPKDQGKTDVWCDPFADDRESATEGENNETTVEEQDVPETQTAKQRDIHEAPDVSHSLPGTVMSKRKWLTPLNIVLGTVLLLVLVAGGGFLWKKLASDNGDTLLSPAVTARTNTQPKMYNEHTTPSQSEIPTRKKEVPLVQDDMPASTTPTQITTPSVAVSHEKWDTEIEQLREALKELRSEAQGIGATLRGDEMATIAKDDLAALMQANASLQSQVDAAIVTIQQTKEEKEQAVKKVAEIEARYRSLSEQANKQAATSKNTPPRPAPGARQTRLTEPAKTQETKPVPFTVVGLTDSFIVVKKGAEFKTLQIGQTLDGITLKAINPLKNKITTSAGEFSLSPSASTKK